VICRPEQNGPAIWDIRPNAGDAHAQRSKVWHAAGYVTAGLRTASLSTHIQLANEATRLLREAGWTLYRHVIVDEAQDLHPAQRRLLRAAVPPGPDDLFISADPHQRIYDNRVSLASLGAEQGVVPALAALTPPVRTRSHTPRTCSASGASCSSRAPEHETTCTSPTPASRVRSSRQLVSPDLGRDLGVVCSISFI